jgi:hypothetical protein
MCAELQGKQPPEQGGPKGQPRSNVCWCVFEGGRRSPRARGLDFSEEQNQNLKASNRNENPVEKKY